MIALFLVALPGTAFAQTQVTEQPIGTCMQLEGSQGYYQKLSDGTWAAPSDKLNSCQGGLSNILTLGNLTNQYQYGSTLGQMTYQQWLAKCVFMNTLLPLAECQGFNQLYGNYSGQLGSVGNLLSYPQLGRDYIAINTGNVSLGVDLSSSTNKWRDILVGVGMGWLLDRLTS